MSRPQASIGLLVQEAAIYVVEHTPGDALPRIAPCECFRSPDQRISFTLQDRRAIMVGVADIAQAAYRDIEEKTARGRRAAQRIAVETWLKKEGLSSVALATECSPIHRGGNLVIRLAVQ